jgi:hypothetical protein
MKKAFGGDSLSKMRIETTEDCVKRLPVKK